MHYRNLLFGLACGMGVYASYNQHATRHTKRGLHRASVNERIVQDLPEPSGDLSPVSDGQVNRRDTYPINCHLKDWPSADVDSIKQAYSWFYSLWAPLEADAQHCRRVACFGTSGVWLCADSLGFQTANSVVIADKMNDLLDGDHGCLDEGDKTKVQGMQFTSEEWSVLVRGGEDCSADVPEEGIFY